MLIVALYRLAARVLPFVPRGLGYWLCDRAGELLFALLPGPRAGVMSNQRHALGLEALPVEVEASSRQVFRNLIRSYFDQFRLSRMRPEELQRLVTVDGIEHVEEALAGGRGLILVSAHFGAPEVVAQILVAWNYRITVVAEHIQPEEVFQLMTSLRGSQGIEFIPIDGALRPIIRALRQNGLVGLVADRDTSASGIRLPFLGDETRVADGAAKLALRTGAPILVAFCHRLPNNRFHAIGRPAFHLASNGDFEAAVRDGTRRILSEVESFIRATPEQWIVTVPLWRQWESAV